MTSGTSLAAQQWLYYMQEQDLAKDDNGNKIQIEHKYHRGEHQVKRSYGSDTWSVDGYFEKNGVKYFLEFHGKSFYSNKNLTLHQDAIFIQAAVYQTKKSPKPARKNISGQ